MSDTVLVELTRGELAALTDLAKRAKRHGDGAWDSALASYDEDRAIEALERAGRPPLQVA
jgi:hypothetical protein